MAQLSIVSNLDPSASRLEASHGRTAMELMQSAKAAGAQHVADLLRTLEFARRQAEEIVAGGEVYPAGVRAIAEQLVEQNEHSAKSVCAIMQAVTNKTFD